MFKTNQPEFRSLAQIVSERTRPLVAWVGAGLSIPAGLPTWSKLRQILIQALEQKANATDGPTQEGLLGKLRTINAQENHWIAFHILREALGATTYKTTIRDALKDTPLQVIPLGYLTLWKLRLSGMLNLNLDKLATRAFTGVHGTKPVIEFHGQNIKQYAHALGSTTPFIANLHGTYDDSSSWIFTHDDLRKLTESPGYREFLTSCILTRAILFVGISANDVAAGGHLARLQEIGIDFNVHYWITDKRDGESDRWAEQVGVRMIRYDNPDGAHKEMHECVTALLGYLPEEPDAEPVVPRHHSFEEPLPPSMNWSSVLT